MAVDGLRPRRRPRMVFSGFTNAEVEKMEKLLKDAKRPLNKEFYQKVSRSFSSSAARAGKPIVRWTEVQSWFEKRLQDFPGKVPSSSDTSKDDSLLPDTSTSNEAKGNSQMNKDPKAGERTLDISKMEFEARSSKDGAWYDVDRFLSHRTLASGEPEVRVRYDGFGPEEDEWVNVKNAVRRRSVPVEHSECHKVTVGDLVCCFQETKDRANHYDAHVIQIQRKMHDIRGCRCLFFVRYDHDKTEERVHLRQICCRPD